MELIELRRRRRSIRKYSDEAIQEDKLTQILQAGLLAPTSRGMRPWEYYVVKDKDTLKKLSRAKQHGAALIAGCDTAIVVSADSELADTWIEDSSIALAYMDLAAASLGMGNLMLAAHDLGIGSCWVQMRMRKDEKGGDAEQNVRQIMGIEDPFRVVGVLALGIPAEEKQPYDTEGLKWEKVHR